MSKVSFPKGGSGKMVGKTGAGPRTPGTTATKSGNGPKFPGGGNGKMVGRQTAGPAKKQ